MLLKELGELIKACSNPFDDHLKQEFLTSKDVYLVKDIKSKMRNNKSCVIWCSFIHTSERLANLLKQYNPLCVNGTLNIEKRNRVIDAFKQTSPSVLIATMQSCKEGLNLQNATYAYFYDLSLKLEDILQAQDRIHRLSQKEDVFIKFLFYKNTIESWILDLFKLKKHFSVDIFNNFLRLNPDKVFGTSHELSKYLVNEKAA
jgi:SNF2 family DNA or RNA helicase